MQLAAMFRFRETSGYRSPYFNKEVGGDDGSLHQVFLAVDLVLETMSLDNVDAFIKLSRRIGLIAIHEDPGTRNEHIHLQAPYG